MILRTSHLTLSALTEADWPFFLALRQSPDIMRFMGDIATEQEIRTRFDGRMQDGQLLIIRDRSEQQVGDIGLHISAHNPQEADVGYSIAPFAQGKGYASDALTALRDHAFSQTTVTALNAWVLAENQGSVRVLEKLGFRRVQVLEKAFTLNGVAHDDWVYRLVKEA